ncbi:MAG: hypothetical protein WCT04_14910 [Planctomycetota bacterium]
MRDTLDKQLWTEWKDEEEPKIMPHMLRIERIAAKVGRREGRKEGVVLFARENIGEILKSRFGKLPPGISRDLKTIENVSTLKKLLKRAATVESLSAFSLN